MLTMFPLWAERGGGRTSRMRQVARLAAMALLCLLSTLAAAAEPPPEQPVPGAAAPLDPGVEARTALEAGRLRAALAAEVPRRTTCGDAAAGWIEPARSTVAAAAMIIARPQLLVVVDRNPKVQELCIILARPDAPWLAIGGSKVSTGQAGRRDYYITPTGVFLHTQAILDYRAEGTFNENGIRGLGLKGMRVWDFGWQTAVKGWRADREPGDIRLLLHATDPDYLEQRLGRPASQGCVRVPATMNRFLDRHGVLDASYEQAARTDGRILEILPVDRRPTPLAGDALVVIDSGERSGPTAAVALPSLAGAL
jgi:hypothetical protein